VRPLKRIDVWTPGVEFKGGIQEYSRRLVEALAAVRPQARIRVFAKNDAGGGESLPGDVRRVCFGRVPARLRTPAFAARLATANRVSPPDLIVATHANFGPLATFGGAPVPFIVSAHGVEVWNLRDERRRRALAQAWRILPVGEHTASRLRAEVPDLPPMAVLANTVDESRFAIGAPPRSLRERFGIGAGDRVLLTVNRFSAAESYRGYDVTLDAFATLRGSHPNLHWIVAGTGDDRERFAREVQRRGLADRVHLPGFVPDAELPGFYRLCDLFVMPSRLEGFGIVYLEAMACGRPALGGNADGAVDALAGGELGMLVDPDDAKALATSIDGFLRGNGQNPLLRQPEQLRAAMLARFGRERFRARLDEILSEFEASR